mmetsp:Transcript_10402/g.33232  ORF Transcript_10402/g.33232 Transcript_10402/m.33232 type:complete len:250 (-) Transcript_10402:1232-1981(-)
MPGLAALLWGALHQRLLCGIPAHCLYHQQRDRARGRPRLHFLPRRARCEQRPHGSLGCHHRVNGDPFVCTGPGLAPAIWRKHPHGIRPVGIRPARHRLHLHHPRLAMAFACGRAAPRGHLHHDPAVKCASDHCIGPGQVRSGCTGLSQLGAGPRGGFWEFVWKPDARQVRAAHHLPLLWCCRAGNLPRVLRRACLRTPGTCGSVRTHFSPQTSLSAPPIPLNRPSNPLSVWCRIHPPALSLYFPVTPIS